MFGRQFFSNPTPDEMPRTADVVVIGGGPAGTAALWAIERAAPGTRAVLIERTGQIAAGASNAALENFRTCWPALCLARLVSRSLEVFLNADEYLGEGAQQTLGVKRQGYIYCGFNDKQAQSLRKDVERLHDIGLSHVEYLDADEAAYRYPWLGSRVVAIKHDPLAGWLDSHALINLFARSARSAAILLDIAETRVKVSGGRVVGVSTPNGDIAAPHVVIAAGAEARRVGRTAGIEIPVVVRPRQSFTTPYRHAEFPEDAPCVIAASPFPHVRPEAKTGAIFGWEYGWNNRQARADGKAEDFLIDPVYPVDKFKDRRFPSLTLLLMARQFGHAGSRGFADPRYLRGIDHRAGYYVYRDLPAAHVTADDGTPVAYESQRAIIDTWRGIDGLHLSVAHVGHGIMSSPAGGEIIAAKVLGLPLPDPTFADFGLDVPYIEHDTGGLGAGIRGMLEASGWEKGSQ